MRIAYLECFSGISGDMFMGALVDAGVAPKILEEAVAALNIGARLEISRVVRSGISATKVDVWVDGEKDLPREEFWERERHQHENHEPSHADHEHHSHSHPSPREISRTKVSAQHEHGHGCGLAEIRQIISAAAISERAKKTAISIFEALGWAEAKIHNTSIESVHFHEVGAVDAMVDIVCAAVGAEALRVDEFICSPLNVGGGVKKELVTPAGAAIVKTLVSRFAAFPEMKIERSGYGAGTRDFPGHPNVVRLTLGEAVSTTLAASTASETITVLEANLDDLNPQVFGYVIDRLFDEGALDAFGVPVQMKKNRPGIVLTVLCKPEAADKLSQILFSETTTLGVRRRDEARQTLARRLERVSTSWGEVRIKIASMNGTDTNYAPEYEDCRQIAVEHHVPLKQVMGEAVEAYLRVRGEKKQVPQRLNAASE